jgi:transposase
MNTPIVKRYERDEQRRMQAAELFAQDLSNAEIARRLHVSRMSVSHWYQIWQAQGSEGLKVRRPGRQPQLSNQQLQQVAAALLEGPEAHGFETPLWTLARISQLIEKLTGVSHHPSYVWYLLQAMDFSCQKPEPVAKERDDAEIARWLAQEWPRIKRGPSSEGPRSASLMRADSLSSPVSAELGRHEGRHRS